MAELLGAIETEFSHKKRINQMLSTARPTDESGFIEPRARD